MWNTWRHIALIHATKPLFRISGLIGMDRHDVERRLTQIRLQYLEEKASIALKRCDDAVDVNFQPIVVLPSEEDVTFCSQWSLLQSWYMARFAYIFLVWLKRSTRRPCIVFRLTRKQWTKLGKHHLRLLRYTCTLLHDVTHLIK